jgi:hypothetical protein
MTRVVIAPGLDPCFGFLHDGGSRGDELGLGLRRAIEAGTGKDGVWICKGACVQES